MAGSQVVFTGVPAFVGLVMAPTRVKFSLDENDFDPVRMLDVDLAKNPSDVPAAQWATGVDCDQQTGDGLTTIGPQFHGGRYVGAVYLAQRLVTQYASVLSSWPPQPDDVYQYQLVVRSDNGIVTRFHGFKVRVLPGTIGTLMQLAFVRAGARVPAAGAPRTRWIDVGDSSVCDAKANGFTTIDPTTPPGTTGALFLSMATVRDGGNTDPPKVPKNLGW